LAGCHSSCTRSAEDPHTMLPAYQYFGLFRPPVGQLVLFFNDPASPEIYTLSLHDALPIFMAQRAARRTEAQPRSHRLFSLGDRRSEEHTSELQSLTNLVCRLLLEKNNCRQRCKH